MARPTVLLGVAGELDTMKAVMKFGATLAGHGSPDLPDFAPLTFERGALPPDIPARPPPQPRQPCAADLLRTVLYRFADGFKLDFDPIVPRRPTKFTAPPPSS